MPPERVAAAHEVLPQTRLRFMDPQRGVGAGRQAVLLRPQALFVDRVPGLVEDPEKGRREELCVIASGDAAVVRPHASAEWMMSNIEASAAEIKPNLLCGLHAEQPLLLQRKMPPEQLAGSALLRLLHGANQRHQFLSQFRQDGRHILGPRTGLEFVQQRIVGRGVVPESLGFLPFEVDDALQV